MSPKICKSFLFGKNLKLKKEAFLYFKNEQIKKGLQSISMQSNLKLNEID